MTSSTPQPASGFGAGSRSATFRVVLLGVLVALLLASSGTLIWLLAGRRGAADDQQRAREAVMAQAQQFMLRVNTYGPDLLDSRGQMPKYRKLVTEIITPKFKTSFDKQVTIAEQVAKAGVRRVSKVSAVGVATIDADSATALVAGSFVNSYPQGKKKRVSDDPAPFRVEVTMVKTDGTWRVDDFTPVTGARK